jgi:uncharacterized protein YggE
MSAAPRAAIAIGWVCGLVLLAGRADAQTAPEGPPSLRVSAEGRVTAPPDQAEIDIGVTTRAPTSAAAASTNAKQVESVLERLRTTLGSDAMIRTVEYALRPEYAPPKDGRDPTVTGYTATNIVRVKLSTLSRIGEVIDAATAAGANRVQRILFSLANEESVRAEALRQAARKARAQADALAAALGLRVVRVLSASEESVPVRPFESVQALRAQAAATTPIETGPIEVTATVALVVEVSPQTR